MKLKSYTPDNCHVRTASDIPSIGLSISSGKFRFNEAAIALLGIKAMDQISFHHDEEDEGSWFIEKVKTGGFTLQLKDKTALIVCSKTLAKKIADSVAYIGDTGRCLLAGQPTELEGRKLFGVLTNTLINK